jgi:hypothetical protein
MVGQALRCLPNVTSLFPAPVAARLAGGSPILSFHGSKVARNVFFMEGQIPLLGWLTPHRLNAD